MLAEPILVIISQYINQTIMLSSLNLSSNVCQLSFNKDGKKKTSQLFLSYIIEAKGIVKATTDNSS